MHKWYEKAGKSSDVVLSSRVRLARNTTEYPFSTKITAEEGKNLVDRVFECISDSEFADGFELKRMNGIGDNQRQCLYEQQEINRYMARRTVNYGQQRGSYTNTGDDIRNGYGCVSQVGEYVR